MSSGVAHFSQIANSPLGSKYIFRSEWDRLVWLSGFIIIIIIFLFIWIGWEIKYTAGQ